MRKNRFLIIPFIFGFLCPNLFGQKNISDYIKLLPLDKCYSTDLPLTDTLVDVKNGYFEISNSGDPKNAIVQAAVFKNADSTVTIAITGLFQDQQCSFYHSIFYEYSKKTNRTREIPAEKILPATEIKLLLNSKTLPIISAKLKTMKGKNPRHLATEDVIRELYSLHCIIPRQGSMVTVTLSICDYVLVDVRFLKNEWEMITTDFKNQTLSYDPKRKLFILQK